MDKTTILSILLVIAIIMIPVAYGVGKDRGTVKFPAALLSSEPAVYTPKSEPSGEWHELGQWSGSGSKTTRYITVKGEEFRIHWSTQTTTQFGGMFNFWIERDDGVERLEANVQGAASDTTYGTGPGRFRLKISSLSQTYEIRFEGRN